MTVTAPAMSKLLCACSSRDSGTLRSAATNTAIPTGMFTKKIHGHESASTRMPPSTSPTAPPPTAIAAHTPIAFVRSAPSEKVAVMIERAAGAMRAAPSPCSPRKRMSDLGTRGEPVQQRRDGEDHETDEEDLLAAGEVARAAAQQEEAAERERVRVHDPLQVGLRHLQVGLDRRERDVHDRRVQDHHELRHADEHEHEPRVDAVFVLRGAADGGVGHERRTLPIGTIVTAVTEMRLYDLRVTVERIEGRSVCGLEVGDWFEVTESSRVRIPEGRHFCLFAMQSVLPLLPAKMRRLPDEDWLEQDSLVACPDPDERLVMRIERIGERTLLTEELT